MSYTIWSYDYDAAPFHNNSLGIDTFDDINQAVRVARQCVKETNHNTGWAKVIDNQLRGHLGDCGIVAEFKKTAAGHVRMYYRREGLDLGPTEHLEYCREQGIDPYGGYRYINQSDFTANAKRLEAEFIAKHGKSPTYVTVLNHCSTLVQDCINAGRGHRIKVPFDWRKQMRQIAMAI